MALDLNPREVRIERYFPDVLANAKEFKALADAINPELKLNWQALIKQMANTFVYDLDKDGAARWEDMLNLHPLRTDTLDARKKRILTKINSTLPYTFRSFQNMLDGIYGKGQVTERLNADEYELWLDLAAKAMGKNAATRRLARVIAPANLTINISNTKSVQQKLYWGGIVRVTHRTIIEAGKDPHLTGDYPVNNYHGGLVYNYKHITIGGPGNE